MGRTAAENPASYGPNDSQVRQFLSGAASLSGDAWVHGVLATRLHQDLAATASAQAELSQAVSVAIAAGFGDDLRAADQHALAIVETQIPQRSADRDPQRLGSARRGIEQVTRGAVLAIFLRERLRAETFTILCAPFAGVIRMSSAGHGPTAGPG